MGVDGDRREPTRVTGVRGRSSRRAEPNCDFDRGVVAVIGSIDGASHIGAHCRCRGREEASAGRPIVGSGGAGATGALFDGIDRLTPETKARLEKIMVPQATPEECVHLEMGLMHRGIYYRDAPMYDEAWRHAQRPDFPTERLKSIAREWDGPFSVERVGDHAIKYFEGEKGERWGPQFLRRTDDGWITDASSVAKFIVYDYSNRAWYAVDDAYPYLPIIKSVYDMKRVSLRNRGPAWMIDASRRHGRSE